MFRWFVDNSGAICSVLGGVAIVSGFVVMAVFSFVTMPIPVLIGLGTTIGGLLVGAAISGGACYLGRQFGIRSERERQQTRIENERALELDRLNSEEAALNSSNSSVAQVVSGAQENSQIISILARLSGVEGRVSTLEGAQATRFQSEARRELHDERRLQAMEVDPSSDSDSEVTGLLSQQSMFAAQNLRHRRPAANDSLGLGVELRHRTSNHK